MVRLWLFIVIAKSCYTVYIIPIIAYRPSKDVFMYHLGVENRAVRALNLCTRRPRGIFETVLGVAKSPEGNAGSRDAVSCEHKLWVARAAVPVICCNS